VHVPKKIDYNKNIKFDDGESINLLRVSEVGPYALHVEDSSWAMVNFPNGDCDINRLPRIEWTQTQSLGW